MTDSPEPQPDTVVTLAAVLEATSGPGAVWTRTMSDLNINLVTFSDGDGVADHVNNEVDVLIVVIKGEGVVQIDGEAHTVAAGQICLIPKGSDRSIRSRSGQFAYLTCHRRRQGLWPA